MLRTVGIDVRNIKGTSGGSGHLWNIIKLDGKYYNADATWDSQRLQDGQSYSYFLKCDSEFSNHTCASEFTTTEFLTQYPKANSSYVYSAASNQITGISQNASKSCSAVKTLEKVASVKVKNTSSGQLKISWSAVSGATIYQIYRLEGKKWCRIKTTTDTSYVQKTSAKYQITKGKTYSYKVRAVRKTSQKTTYGKFSEVVKVKCTK
jgi:hypothetical protein